MTAPIAPTPPTPCQAGLRCPNPSLCDHKLHPDDWFQDEPPPAGEEPELGNFADELSWDSAWYDWDARRRAHEAFKAVEAKALWACHGCPLRLQCLDIGMQPGPTLQFGIYGAYTAAQRRAITREIDKKRAQRHKPAES